MSKYVCINLSLMLLWGVVWLCLSVMAFGRAVACINLEYGIMHKLYFNLSLSLHTCTMVWYVSTASPSKYHKDKCLSSPCAVRMETNSDWQMDRGHPVNSHTGQGDIKMSLTGQLIKEGSCSTCTGSRGTFTV